MLKFRPQDVVVAVIVIGMVMMLIVPLPPEMLDVLLAFNIAASVVTILISIYMKNPLEFAAFPTVLLMATLFRLALDVSATRMILLHGHLKNSEGACIGAGAVIAAFGNVVVGGSIVVGLILFVILIIIQFMVITSGAERIAQVAARFTLDAMPGKYMAIDADLHAGAIDAAEATRRRREVERHSDFYGAMDGAGKFVKGDAMAATVIMIVNLLGGILVGVLEHAMGAADAFRTYALLSVGNGLVTTLPAFLMSTSMGMVVTRAASDANLADDVVRQVMAQPMALQVASGFMAVLALLGLVDLFALPWLPFVFLSGLFALIAQRLQRQKIEHEARVVSEEVKKDEIKKVDPNPIVLQIDAISIEVGRALLGLVDPKDGGKLLERVSAIRRHVAAELGIIVPGVRFRDNLNLRPNAYEIKVRDNEAGRGEVMINQFLAIGPQEKLEKLRGTRVTDPTYGMPGIWVSPEQRGEVERLGCMLFDPVSVVATHLTETVRVNADELLGRQEVQVLLDGLKRTHPAVVRDVVPDQLSVGEIQRILQNLVKERVSIRDLVRILETTADNVQRTRDVEILTECARVALCRSICRDYVNNEGELKVLTLDPQIEQMVAQALQRTDMGTFLALDPAIGAALLEALGAQIRILSERGLQPIVLVAPQIRPAVRKLTERSFPSLVVLSWNEIAPRVSVQPVGMVVA